jgi:hypothetical protein
MGCLLRNKSENQSVTSLLKDPEKTGEQQVEQGDQVRLNPLLWPDLGHRQN